MLGPLDNTQTMTAALVTVGQKTELAKDAPDQTLAAFIGGSVALRGYVPKHRKAPWTSAFPEQMATAFSTTEDTPAQRKAIRSVSKVKAKSDAVYRARVKAWLMEPEHLLLCKACAPVSRSLGFSKYPIRATQCHHRFGRRGRLKLWQPGWMPVCAECHDWIHRNVGNAQTLGLIAPDGIWDDFERAQVYVQQQASGL